MTDYHHGIRVIVVDDDPLLGKLLLRYLSRASIFAHTAASLAELSAVFEPGAYTHALVDLTLPDGSGAEWLAEALTRDPLLFGVLTSGYPIATDLLPQSLRHRAAVLQKPFSPAALLVALGLSAPA